MVRTNLFLGPGGQMSSDACPYSHSQVFATFREKRVVLHCACVVYVCAHAYTGGGQRLTSVLLNLSPL